MQRIAKIDDYWTLTPQLADFKKYDTNLLLNRLLVLYGLKKDSKIGQMVHLSQIHNIVLKNNHKPGIDNILCDFINNIPNQCWVKIMNELNFTNSFNFVNN